MITLHLRPASSSGPSPIFKKLRSSEIAELATIQDMSLSFRAPKSTVRRCQVYIFDTRKGCILHRDRRGIQPPIQTRFPLRLFNLTTPRRDSRWMVCKSGRGAARSGRLGDGLVRHGERDAVKQLLADDPGFLGRPLMTAFTAPLLLQQIGRPLWAYVVARIFSAHKRINILGDAKQTACGRRASGSKSWCGSCRTTGKGASIWRRLLTRTVRCVCPRSPNNAGPIRLL